MKCKRRKWWREKNEKKRKKNEVELATVAITNTKPVKDSSQKRVYRVLCREIGVSSRVIEMIPLTRDGEPPKNNLALDKARNRTRLLHGTPLPATWCVLLPKIFHLPDKKLRWRWASPQPHVHVSHYYFQASRLLCCLRWPLITLICLFIRYHVPALHYCVEFFRVSLNNFFFCSITMSIRLSSRLSYTLLLRFVGFFFSTLYINLYLLIYFILI